MTELYIAAAMGFGLGVVVTIGMIAVMAARELREEEE